MQTEQNTNESSEASEATKTIYYWSDGYYTEDPEEAQMANDWELYGGIAETISVPVNYDNDQIEILIRKQLYLAHTPRVGPESVGRIAKQ